MIIFPTLNDLYALLAYPKKHHLFPKVRIISIVSDEKETLIKISFNKEFTIHFDLYLVAPGMIEDLCRVHTEELAMYRIRAMLADYLADNNTAVVSDTPHDDYPITLYQQIKAFVRVFGNE